jgi:hypothetical protein
LNDLVHQGRSPPLLSKISEQFDLQVVRIQTRRH